MRIRDAAAKAVLLIVCLFLTSIPSFAEIIILKSGKKIDGKIVERTDKYIKVDSGIGVDVIYFLDEIDKIEGGVTAAPQSPAENKVEKTSVAQYDSEAFLRIKEGKWEEGLSLLKQATILEPKSGLPHMNYGSMLLARGQMLLKEGKTEEAKSILKEAEKELLSAIQQSGTATVDAIAKGQSAFLLGDIYCFIYKDGIKAKEFYKKSLEYFPKHDMAKYALAREEKLQPFFDNRKWIIGDQQENKTTLIREYVLEGETVTNGSELVTVQIFKDMQKVISAKKFSEGTKEEISKICPGIMWNVLSESDNDIICEWSIQGCAGQSDQHEIARTLSGTDGIYVLHYATKKVPISPERREEWIRLLKLYVVK